MCVGHQSTDGSMPEAERAAIMVLRMTVMNAALSISLVLAGMVRAIFDTADPVAIGAGGSVILLLAYLYQLSVPAEIERNLALLPELGSRRLRVLRLGETVVGAFTIGCLCIAGCALVGWSIAKLL